MKQTLPDRLAQLRILRGLSQNALADLCQVAPSTISLLESGQAKDVKLSTVQALCTVLAVTPDYLTGYDIDDDHARAILRARWDPTYTYIAKDPAANSQEEKAKCGICHTILRANGGRHGMGECLVIMRISGKSLAYMAALFGLQIESIERLLEEAHEAMRTRYSKKRRVA